MKNEMNMLIPVQEIDKQIIRLAYNENPYGISERSLGYLQKMQLKKLPYPDSDAHLLRKTIAEMHNKDYEQIYISNGIDELILAIALTFMNRDNNIVLLNDTTFLGYEAAVEMLHGTAISLPLVNYRISTSEYINGLEQHPAIAFLCNPHNPTGSMLHRKELESIIETSSQVGTLLVVDEAYGEYAGQAFCSAVHYLDKCENIMVLRTLSKIYGLAGLRCGYAISSKSAIDRLKKIKKVLPYNVNYIVQQMAIESLKDKEYIAWVSQQNEMVKQWLCGQLKRIGIEFVESYTNFVLIKLPFSSKDFARKLLEHHRILIRNGDDFGFLNHLRVSIGTKVEMELLVEFLEQEMVQER